MEIHEALYTTRAMRRLKPDPVPLNVQARILDAAIRAPHVGEQWRFVLVDDRGLMRQLAELYRQSWQQFLAEMGTTMDQLVAIPGTPGKAARSAAHLVNHFEDVPLVLIGIGKSRDGASIYPALWSAMLAARAEGIGSTLTTVLHVYQAAAVETLLGVPPDEGWVMRGVVPMGYPTGRWGVATRVPVEAVAGRNGWQGDLGFTVPEPLWPDATEPSL